MAGFWADGFERDRVLRFTGYDVAVRSPDAGILKSIHFFFPIQNRFRRSDVVSSRRLSSSSLTFLSADEMMRTTRESVYSGKNSPMLVGEETAKTRRSLVSELYAGVDKETSSSAVLVKNNF